MLGRGLVAVGEPMTEDLGVILVLLTAH